MRIASAPYSTATRAESSGAGRLKITGDLTIHGVTKQVVMDVDASSQPITDPMGKGVEQVRPIRDEIDKRVQALLAELTADAS